MEREMRSDAELLVDICNEAPLVLDRVTGRLVPLSRKIVAFWTGLSIQTISDYCLGNINIPIRFWRAILEHTFDRRILELLLPDDYEADVIAPNHASPVNARQFFRAAVEESKAFHDKQCMIADILADGRIDELDANAVQTYADRRAYHKHLEATLHWEIIQAFNRSVAAKAEARP